MRAEDLLNALPLKYYVFDLKNKKVVQTNDPQVLAEQKTCYLQILNFKQPCQKQEKTCFCELVEKNSEFQYIVESGEGNKKHYFKACVKKTDGDFAVATFTDITRELYSEKEIKINNLRLQRAEELASIGSWEIDLKTNTMIATAGACKIYGVAKKEFCFEEMKKIPLPEYIELLEREMEDLISGTKNYNIRFRIKRPNDGEIRYIHSVGEYREDKKKVFGVIHDITEMVLFESALHESITDLRMAQNIARIGNWKFNPESKSLKVSDQVRQILFEYSIPVQPEITDFKKLIGTDNFPVFENSIFQAINNGMPFQEQFNIRLPDYSKKWIEIICQPDGEKGVAGYVLRGTIQDITITKNVEKELQQSNNLFHTLIQTLPDAIYMKDVQYRKIIANKEDAGRCGMEKVEQVLGKTDFELYTEEVASRYYEDDRMVIEKGMVVLNREEILPGNPKRWILTTKVPLKDKQGQITGMVGIGHDITHRKKMEEELKAAKIKAEESDRLKSVFLANMSHEIRTPLNGLLGFSNFICSGTPDKGQLKNYAQIIDKCGKRLTGIIDDIIDISLIQSNQLQLNYSKFNLLELLEELLSFYKHQKREQLTSIDLKLTNLLPGESAIFYIDKNRIYQVLNKLLDNAFKFTQSGYIELGCFISEQGELNLFVEDSGIGIEESKLEVIFENFRQVEEGLSRQYEGAGLGLPIVSGMVTRMGGTIRVKSIPGCGSTFFVSLPEKKGGEEEKAAVNNHAIKNQPALKKEEPEKIIVSFEDDPASIEYLKSVAGLMDCRLVNFDRPVKGIEYLRKNRADLIFMDVRLPEMSGFEATQIIKNEFPNLPVIIQTAYALKDDREKAFSAGCDDYLAKPVPLKDLKGRIKHFIGE